MTTYDFDEYSEMYSLVCDVVERTYHGWSLTHGDDDIHVCHTSDEARGAANRIFEVLDVQLTPDTLSGVLAPSGTEGQALEAEQWVDLGIVGTDVATVAIVDPLFAKALSDWWSDHVANLTHDEAAQQYRDLKLETTWSRGWSAPGWPAGPFTTQSSAVVVNTPGNGGFTVKGRFADTYDGPLRLAEVRIVFYDDDDDDDLDDEDDDLDQ